MGSIYEQVLSTLYGVWRKRWYGLAAMWIVCLVGWAIVAMNPETKRQGDVIDLSLQNSIFQHWAGVLSNGDVLYLQQPWSGGQPTLNRINPKTQAVTTIRNIALTSNSAIVDMDFVASPLGDDRVTYVHYDETKKTYQVMVSQLDGTNAHAVSQEFAYIRWQTWSR